MGQYSMTVRDYSDEYSNARFPMADRTAANFDAQQTLANSLQSAVEGVILGSTAREAVIASENTVNDVRPANAFAQRELKWLVRYHDNVSLEKSTVTIPTANVTGLLVAGTDLADLSQAAWVTFIAAFEGGVLGASGNAVTIDSVQLVGRKL